MFIFIVIYGYMVFIIYFLDILEIEKIVDFDVKGLVLMSVIFGLLILIGIFNNFVVGLLGMFLILFLFVFGLIFFLMLFRVGWVWDVVLLIVLMGLMSVIVMLEFGI